MPDDEKDKTNPGGDWGGPKIHIDFDSLKDIKLPKFEFSRRQMKSLEDAVKKMDGFNASYMPPEERRWSPGGGNIYIEGMGDMTRMFGSPSIMRDLLGLRRDEEDIMQSTASIILGKVAQVWNKPLDWQFSAGHNAGQNTFWLTAAYKDDEADEPLVQDTIEITEEQMAVELTREGNELEHAIEAMQQRCEADLAAFEE